MWFKKKKNMFKNLEIIRVNDSEKFSIFRLDDIICVWEFKSKLGIKCEKDDVGILLIKRIICNLGKEVHWQGIRFKNMR